MDPEAHPITFDSVLSAERETLLRSDLFRSLTEIASAQGPQIQIGGKEYLNFSSNDYLGLANDPHLKQAATRAVEKFGVGTGASRLICGTQSPHVALEKKIAAFKRKEAALVFSSGYAANVGTITALVNREDVILCDKLNHASIIDAARLSGATLRVYPHGNLKKLRSLLSNSSRFRRRLIVTETVFSMDGDLVPLAEIVQLKENFGSWLLIDEAHATGIFGSHQRGIAELVGVEEQVEITMGTLSKALGTMGGYVAGSHQLIDLLVNRARSFIYSTAPPPSVCAAAEAAIQIIEREPQRRDKLLNNVKLLRAGLRELGLPIPLGESPIIPVVLGNPAVATAAARRLFEAGIFVPAIRPPTVPRGQARLRLVVSSAHTHQQISRLIEGLRFLVASCTTAV